MDATRKGDDISSFQSCAGSSGMAKDDSNESLDRLVKPLNVESPWNKGKVVETEFFEEDAFLKLCHQVAYAHSVRLEPSIFQDIYKSTRGHPGSAMFLLEKSIQYGVGKWPELTTANWVSKKREVYLDELLRTPTMTKMLDWAMKPRSRLLKDALQMLARDFYGVCSDSRVTKYLRAIGIAIPVEGSKWITLSSPIIRHTLLTQFFPPFDEIEELYDVPNELPRNYLRKLILASLRYFKASVLLDPLVRFKKGLSEASVHAELYRILHSLLRQAGVDVLTETRVVPSSDVQCDLWIKNSSIELGIEVKTEEHSAIASNC